MFRALHLLVLSGVPQYWCPLWSVKHTHSSFLSAIEMSIWSNQHHQFTKWSGEGHHTSLLCQLIQAPSVAHPPSGSGARTCWHQWDRKVNCSQDSCRKTETQSRQIYSKNSFFSLHLFIQGMVYESFVFDVCLAGPTKLARSSHIFQRVGVAEIFYQDPWGWFEGLFVCNTTSLIEKSMMSSTYW